MREIVIPSNENLVSTETGVNPGSDSTFSGTILRWNCGCISASGGYCKLCASHKRLPPVIRMVSEPIKVDLTDTASHSHAWDECLLVCDTEHIKKIRRRVEDALRKGGTGQILRCAEILEVKIS